MVTSGAPDAVEALERGEAFVELADARLTSVHGRDARAWLHDLVTTDVASLRVGGSRPSLLLSPTGRIRARFAVACVGDDAFVLIQREPLGSDVAVALSPYVLSSDVEITPSPLGIISVPGRDDVPVPVEGTTLRPSVLGGGMDLLVEDAKAVATALGSAGLAPATLETADRRRIRRGEARFGYELDADSLPAEAGLDVAPVTDRTKGCFLGQEAIAKVANLGHPTRIVLTVEASGPVRVGDEVLVGGAAAGVVTSADEGRALIRVAWAAREAPLVTGRGVALERR